ncbi:PQQ-binding-like beta-propeller repeat protein [Dactylosporangium sp. NPDC049140]|uniref:outer membrane protein assembly factor BamB family protein n=1 Tax=Dactylosporangium sp. NPDC049140 TaxID=3155647 RepID=UPI0033C5719E
MIDLDAYGGLPQPGADRPRRSRLPLLLLAGAAVALLTGTGAPASLDPAVRLPGDGVIDLRVDGGTVYLVSRESLAAYRASDGRRRWTAPVTPGSRLVSVEAGRVVLAHNDPDFLAGFDAATGDERWRAGGFVPSVYGTAGASGVVVATTDESATVTDAGIDIRTGAVRWSLGPPGDVTRTLVREGERVAIAELTAGGALRVRSADSAAVVRTAALDHPDPFNWFDISGDRLLAIRTNDRGVTLDGAVYDLTTGRRLWRRDNGPDGEPLWWCAPLVCAGNAGAVTVLDPGTGRELWHLDGLTDIGSPDARFMLATPYPQDAAGPGPGLLVLDPATGRVLRRIPDWYVIGTVGGDGILAATTAADGTTLIGRLDAGTGAVRVFARAGHWTSPPCTATQTRLVCRLDPVAVWPVPAARS